MITPVSGRDKESFGIEMESGRGAGSRDLSETALCVALAALNRVSLLPGFAKSLGRGSPHQKADLAKHQNEHGEAPLVIHSVKLLPGRLPAIESWPLRIHYSAKR